MFTDQALEAEAEERMARQREEMEWKEKIMDQVRPVANRMGTLARPFSLFARDFHACRCQHLWSTRHDINRMPLRASIFVVTPIAGIF